MLAMLSPSGAAQRLNSSISTRLGATWTTNSARSTEAGTDTGPTITAQRAGGVPSAAVAARLGDVALVPFAPTAFLDPADTGELRLKGRHGSLTPAEMLIPLLAWRLS